MSNKLLKPYTTEQKADFVIANKGKNYIENNEAIYFLEDFEILNEDGTITDISQTAEYISQKLNEKKEIKLNENNKKSELARISQTFNLTIQGQECEFDTKDRTQTDLITAFITTSEGETYDGWVTNNGISLNLTTADLSLISQTFREKANVYTTWKAYYDEINSATTLEELNNIKIVYTT